MHYYSFNIGDYRKDTVHLSPIEHYIYRTLIDMYYLSEEPIPKETHWVMRRLNLGSQEEETALKNVLNDFFYEVDDGFRHERIDAEIEKYQANAEKNRKNGKKGGRPPKNKPKETQSVSDGLPDESKQNPNQEPLTTNHQPLTINHEPVIAFDEFWEAYDKKIDRAKCLAKWEKLTEQQHQEIMSNVHAYVAANNVKQYRKNPLTYLNGECWLDEIITSQPTRNNQGLQDAKQSKLNELEQYINSYGTEQEIRHVN